MTNRSVVAAALKLPRQEKLRLLKKLQRIVADEDVLKAGALEAEKAWRAYRRGEMGAKPADEVIQRLLKRKPRKK